MVGGGADLLLAREVGLDQPVRLAVRLGGELPEAGRVAVLEPLVGIEPQDVGAGGGLDAVVAGIGEGAVPGEVQHRRAERLGDLDRAVGRARVDDHDLVDAVRARGEAVREHLLLVLHDHAQRDAHPSAAVAARFPRSSRNGPERVTACRARGGGTTFTGRRRRAWGGAEVAGQVLEARVEPLGGLEHAARRATPRSGRTARRRRSSGSTGSCRPPLSHGRTSSSSATRAAPSGSAPPAVTRRSAPRRRPSGSGRRRRRRPRPRARRRCGARAASPPWSASVTSCAASSASSPPAGSASRASASASRPCSQRRSGRAASSTWRGRSSAPRVIPPGTTMRYHLRRIRGALSVAGPTLRRARRVPARRPGAPPVGASTGVRRRARAVRDRRRPGAAGRSASHAAWIRARSAPNATCSSSATSAHAVRPRRPASKASSTRRSRARAVAVPRRVGEQVERDSSASVKAARHAASSSVRRSSPSQAGVARKFVPRASGSANGSATGCERRTGRAATARRRSAYSSAIASSP